MSKPKQFIVISASITTAKESFTRGQLLNEEQYKSLPEIFKKKVEPFDESKKEHLRLSHNHESPTVQKPASAINLKFVNARLDRVEEALKLKPLNSLDGDALTEDDTSTEAKETKEKK